MVDELSTDTISALDSSYSMGLHHWQLCKNIISMDFDRLYLCAWSMDSTYLIQSVDNTSKAETVKDAYIILGYQRLRHNTPITDSSPGVVTESNELHSTNRNAIGGEIKKPNDRQSVP